MRRGDAPRLRVIDGSALSGAAAGRPRGGGSETGGSARGESGEPADGEGREGGLGGGPPGGVDGGPASEVDGGPASDADGGLPGGADPLGAPSRARGMLGTGRLRALGGPPTNGGEAFDWRRELELVAPDVTLPPGCSRDAIAAAEGSLGLALPTQQAEFLAATDGVYDGDSHYWYAWSLERVVDENFDYERPGDLLAVGDDAGSGWFCVPLDGSGVVHYDRASGVRRTLARDLRGLWLGWFGGTLGV